MNKFYASLISFLWPYKTEELFQTSSNTYRSITTGTTRPIKAFKVGSERHIKYRSDKYKRKKAIKRDITRIRLLEGLVVDAYIQSRYQLDTKSEDYIEKENEEKKYMFYQPLRIVKD